MIYFVRHTKVGIAKGICYGHSEVPLAKSFTFEAQMVNQMLSQISFSSVYSSPLSRCLKLATYCGFSKIKIEDDLIELDFGDWEMQKWDTIDMSIWEKDWINNPPPNGESFAMMYQRTTRFFNQIAPQKGNIIIFTHNGVINCAKAYYKNIKLENTFNTTTPYGGIYCIENEK